MPSPGMKQALQLRLGQHLTMTPQLQQAIRLLQLSTIELQVEVQQALDSNMMLERADEEGDTPAAEAAQNETETEVKPTDIPPELPVDSKWEDIYDGNSYGSSSGDSDYGSYEFDSQRTATQTLADHLHWQKELTNFSETDAVIASAIIDATDDDGYLSISVEELQNSVVRTGLDVNAEEVEAVLRQVQNFDPPGVAARDLRECLQIQLKQLPEDTPWREEAMNVVTELLDLLAAHDYGQLMRRTGLDKNELQQAIALIQSMTPRPGALVYSEPAQYVVPDVFVRKDNGFWNVELNPDASPRLRINAGYAGLVKRADNSADNSCLRTHLQEARWFLKSLQSRSETLLKVATCIVERQRQFLEHGEEAMKPMVLHDVAEAVGMHESTISRVTTHKYMHTPRGIYELKYFFSSHVSTAGGGEASSTAIRALLKKLIAAENPQKPLSDSKLAGILSEQGINVARRTVAKYREALLIPSSSERKRFT